MNRALEIMVSALNGRHDAQVSERSGDRLDREARSTALYYVIVLNERDRSSATYLLRPGIRAPTSSLLRRHSSI